MESRLVDTAALATGQTRAQAREFAAIVLRAGGRPDLAEVALRGQGDDFPEVRGALTALAKFADRSFRFEEALQLYSEEGFWDDDLPGGALAMHDRGEIARNVLSGRRPFFHRD